MTTVPYSRSLVLAVTAACLIGGGCGSTSRSQAASGPSPAIAGQVPRATGDVPFERAWELTLPSRVERSWIGEQVPELVFFQVEGDHSIHCVDARSGQTRWISETLPKAILGEAFVQRLVQPGEREKEVRIEERLFIVVDDTLYCYDVATGQRVWHYLLPFAPATGPLASGSTEGSLRVFVGDWNDRLQVITLHQGTDDKQVRFPYVVWQMNLPGTILSSGIETEDLNYFGDTAGHLRCFKLDRTQVWDIQTGGSIEGGATVRGRALYAGNDGNAVHAINRLTGERLGQFNLQGPVRSRPFWFSGEPDRLYVWIDSPDMTIGGLAALRVQPDNVAYTDGAKHALEVVRMGQDWLVPGARRLVGSTPLHLLLADDAEHVVWAVQRGTGKVEWTWDVSKNWPKAGSSVAHLVKHHDRTDTLRSLIAADDQGNVVSFRVFGFVPTPGQLASGITSRSLANQAAPPAAAKPKDAEPKEPVAPKAE